MLVFPTSGLGLLSLPHPSTDAASHLVRGWEWQIALAGGAVGSASTSPFPGRLVLGRDYAPHVRTLGASSPHDLLIMETGVPWGTPEPEPIQVFWTKDSSEGGECRAVSGPSWCLEATLVPQRPKGVSWNRWLSGCPKSEPH